MQRTLFLTLLFCAAAAAADIDQARKEGEIVWYTAMNVPDAEVLRKPFNERYPFIKITLLRSTGEIVRTRILYGENDRGEAAKRARKAKELNPELRLELLPRCAHLLH